MVLSVTGVVRLTADTEVIEAVGLDQDIMILRIDLILAAVAGEPTAVDGDLGRADEERVGFRIIRDFRPAKVIGPSRAMTLVSVLERRM
jgi:hypothetical protein